MWWVVGTLKTSLDGNFFTKKEFSRVLSCHVAVSSEWCLLVEASLCLEAAERRQWLRMYSLGRPRSHGCMPSLVSDSGQVFAVLGWALTRMRNIPVTKQMDPPEIVPPGPTTSKYLDPPVQILQSSAEVIGPPRSPTTSKYLDSLLKILQNIYLDPRSSTGL